MLTRGVNTMSLSTMLICIDNALSLFTCDDVTYLTYEDNIIYVPEELW